VLRNLRNCVAQANLRDKRLCPQIARSGSSARRQGYVPERRTGGGLLVFSGSGAEDAEVAAAAHLDALADRFGYGRALLAEALGVLDPLRVTGAALAARAPGAPSGPGLADDVRQCLQVVCALLGGIGR